MWIRSTIPFFIALVPAMLWILFLFPLVLRLFGVPFQLGFRRRKQMEMDQGQTVLWGAIGWGGYMIICNVVEAYVQWKMYGTPSDMFTMRGLGQEALMWITGGTVFGFVSVMANKNQTITLNLTQPPNPHP
jgi:hypothetical protein